MKKNVLALSITAALIGLTGGAHAMSGFAELQGASANAVAVNTAGIGHAVIVPYFTTQGDNTTLLNIVNTDTVGKVVKIRFRGAANSDDLFDFQIFMSAKDVWTASLTKLATGNNLTQLTTTDNTCTKPARAIINATPFITSRLDTQMTEAGKANGTREGYVEIFNMADIPVTIGGVANPLYTAIVHSQSTGIPPGCGLPGTATAAAWNAMDDSNTTWTYDRALAKGLRNPTSGLMANWTVIDTNNAATWSGEAVALEAYDTTSPSARATGNIVYWPQIPEALPLSAIDPFTGDPIMRAAATGSATAVALGWSSYDLPDMSTPYTLKANRTATASASEWVESVSAAVASTSATNEFWTESAFGASDDWVFSMPQRRYQVAYDYASGTMLTTANSYFATGYNLTVKTNTETLGNGRQICVSRADMTISPVDREERVPAGDPTQVVISPSLPTQVKQFAICGEVSVLSINNGAPAVGRSSGALKASVTLQDLSTATIGGANAEKYGWMQIALPGITSAGKQSGLPLMGGSFVRAALGTKGFGASHTHRFARTTGFVAR